MVYFEFKVSFVTVLSFLYLLSCLSSSSPLSFLFLFTLTSESFYGPSFFFCFCLFLPLLLAPLYVSASLPPSLLPTFSSFALIGTVSLLLCSFVLVTCSFMFLHFVDVDYFICLILVVCACCLLLFSISLYRCVVYSTSAPDVNQTDSLLPASHQ